jgi:hypothetical protein
MWSVITEENSRRVQHISFIQLHCAAVLLVMQLCCSL